MKTLHEIAKLVGGSIRGNPNIKITGFAGIEDAKEGDITFIDSRRYLKLLGSTHASAVVAPLGYKCPETLNVIFHKSPSEAFALITDAIACAEVMQNKGISSKAGIEQGALIGKDVTIDAYVIVSAGAKIGDKTVLHPFVYVGKDTIIGDNCVIYPNVTVREKCIIGRNVIIHSGAVIGSDGFGYLTKQGKYKKIAQRGIVEIGNEVEIGSNVTIDRARIGRTIIGSGTKIDNLVMIAHNVKIGENSIIVAQSGISGSTELGSNVTVAGQAGFAGHIKIGEGSIIGARSGVLKSLPPKSVVSGFPAMDHRKELNLLAYYRKLPQLFRRFEALEKSQKKANRN